ncbi:MAG TPA: sigma 54-interacting transcriptional regulator [Polyangiaceae bacterium]|jgi:transcriptional regulator with GAF, ATPase, and Fis domain|nr:sigma 54-interacting transcriptional regulator [Polyangiaceae bacterium]
MPTPADLTRAKDGPTVVRYSKTRVTVTEGPDSGQTRDIVSNTLRIGTAPDNDLVLRDNTVSRHHCALEPVNGGMRVRDEGSTNGVLLAGVRVFDAVVPGVAELRLGDTLLNVEPLPETVSREQATEDRFGDLLGSSARMRELFADLARIAPVDVTLLIEGETGTGKELVAECVHRESLRSSGPFVVFDCSAIAPTLAESELFGHERGAFTGAVASRPGVFEQADGGTIFLDELGELPKDLQPKLLRVLEKRQVRRLGSQRTIPIDVRLIAATNRNLAAEVAAGNFREDLYFRVAAAHVHVPPLRDRMDDLRLLTAHFLSRAKPPRSIAEVPEQVWDMFAAHRWPGNVRELGNAVQRLLVTPERALPAATTTSRPPPPDEAAVTVPLRVARREASDAFERSYLEALLERTGGNVTRAAAIAEVSRQMVQKLMRKHGIG